MLNQLLHFLTYFSSLSSDLINFWATVLKRFALCDRTIVCLLVCLSVRLSVCLSVCNVVVLWPNGWIKMPLGTEVGLGPGDSVLDGDPAPPTKRCTAAPTPYFLAHVALALWPISATVGFL